MALDNLSVGTFADVATCEAFITARGWTKQIGWRFDDSTLSLVREWNGYNWNILHEIEQIYTWTGHSLGASGVTYSAGFYRCATTIFALTQVTPSQTYGTANIMNGGYVFAVCGGPGVVTGGGTVALQVQGTSISDLGVRTPADTEILAADITTLVLNQYLQSTKRFIGVVTWALIVTGGAPVTYNLNINYGFTRPAGLLRPFRFTGLSIMGLSTASDASLDVQFIYHNPVGWTYNNGAFVAGPTALISTLTTCTPESQAFGGQVFSYRRTGMTQAMQGNVGEGYIIRIVTSAVSAVHNMHMKVTLL